MKIKSLTCMVAVLFVVGFCGSALAVLDGTGDELCTNKDLSEVEVLYFDAASGPADDSIKVGVEMNSGSSLPGLVTFEVDVDNNSLTGGPDITVSIVTCASGGTSRIKQPVGGTDVLVMIMLRDQLSDAGTAWCDGCAGPGSQCFERGAACAGECGGTDCYKAGTPCDADSGPDCYIAGDPCNEPRPTCDQCYELNVVCTAEQPCGTGRRRGEWYADTSVGGQVGSAPAEWGRIDMPLPKAADDPIGIDTYPLPWGRIIEKVHAKATLVATDPAKVFDLANAQDPANFRYQLAVWYDEEDTSPPANDYINEFDYPPFCAEACDVVPDAGLAAVEVTKVCTTGCQGDFDTDADVDGTDAVNFKADFFRKNCLNADLRAR